MNEYVIFTDSGCDLPGSLLSEWGIPCKNLHLHFDGDDTSSLEDIDIGNEGFFIEVIDIEAVFLSYHEVFIASDITSVFTCSLNSESYLNLFACGEWSYSLYRS